MQESFMVYFAENPPQSFGADPLLIFLLLGLLAFAIMFFIELEFGFMRALPRLCPLLKVLVSRKPYREFGNIADNCLASRLDYLSGDLSSREEVKRFSKKISRLATLKIANRILEFRLWQRVRHCSDYEQLLDRSIAFLQGSGQDDFIFVSSPLYSHADGLAGGIKELRRAIIAAAEENHGRVFNQIPCLDIYLSRISSLVKDKFAAFYGPFIGSPLIAKIKMNAGYEASSGCQLELEYARRFSKPVEY